MPRANIARAVVKQFRDTPPRPKYLYCLAVRFDSMRQRPEKKRVRRRGDETESLYVKVSPEVFDHLDQLATTLNMPKWALVEAGIRSITAETVQREFPEAFTDDELELPINVAA